MFRRMITSCCVFNNASVEIQTLSTDQIIHYDFNNVVGATNLNNKTLNAAKENSELILNMEIEQITTEILKSYIHVVDNSLDYATLNLSDFTQYTYYSQCYVQIISDYLKCTKLIFLSLSLVLKELLKLTQLSINTIFHYYKTTTKNLLQDYFLIASNKGFNTNLHIHDLGIGNHFQNYLFIQYYWRDHEKLLSSKI